jgi:hypothetical protein
VFEAALDASSRHQWWRVCPGGSNRWWGSQWRHVAVAVRVSGGGWQHRLHALIGEAGDHDYYSLAGSIIAVSVSGGGKDFDLYVHQFRLDGTYINTLSSEGQWHRSPRQTPLRQGRVVVLVAGRRQLGRRRLHGGRINRRSYLLEPLERPVASNGGGLARRRTHRPGQRRRDSAYGLRFEGPAKHAQHLQHERVHGIEPRPLVLERRLEPCGRRSQVIELRQDGLRPQRRDTRREHPRRRRWSQNRTDLNLVRAHID